MYQQLPQPTVFAHRGASIQAPENTIAAFELAVTQKADAIELDAKLCGDGQVMVIHDQTVDRTTDGSGKLLEMPLAALKELDAGSWFDAQFSGEPLPTLEEVFEAVGKKIFINIELTNYASVFDNLPNKVVQLVKKYELQDNVLFSSFNPVALRRAHQLLPEVPLGLLALPGFAGAWARSWLGNWVPYLALHPDFDSTTPQLIEKQHKQGKRVYVWTVNDSKKMQQLFEWGVDGIFTDDPLLGQQSRGQTPA
jgi:glycerophosphoryl diester phosphodiesterase